MSTLRCDIPAPHDAGTIAGRCATRICRWLELRWCKNTATKGHTLTRKYLHAAVSALTGRPIPQRCLLRSEFLYRFCSIFDPQADYRVNMVVKFYPGEDSGHAWLTRNGRLFLASPSSVSLHKLTLLGESAKYRYYIKETNVQYLNHHGAQMEKVVLPRNAGR